MKLNAYETRLDEKGDIYMTVANTYKVDGRLVYASPERLINLFGDVIGIKNAATEFLYVGCFDTNLHCVGCFMASAGSVNTSIFPVREIIQKSLMLNAVYITISHNHPSGNTMPSQSDINSTEKIKVACNVVGLQFLDHVIVSPNTSEYYSFVENKR